MNNVMMVLMLLIILASIIALIIINCKSAMIPMPAPKIQKYGGGFTGNQLYELFQSQYLQYERPELCKGLNIISLSDLHVRNCDEPHNRLILNAADADLIKDKIVPNAAHAISISLQSAVSNGALSLIIGPLAGHKIASSLLPRSSKYITTNIKNAIHLGVDAITNAPNSLYPQTINFCLNNFNFRAYVDYVLISDNSGILDKSERDSTEYTCEIDPNSIKLIALHKGTLPPSLTSIAIADWWNNIDNMFDTSKYTKVDTTVDWVGALQYLTLSTDQHHAAMQGEKIQDENFLRMKYYTRRHTAMLGYRAIKLFLKNLLHDESRGDAEKGTTPEGPNPFFSATANKNIDILISELENFDKNHHDKSKTDNCISYNSFSVETPPTLISFNDAERYLNQLIDHKRKILRPKLKTAIYNALNNAINSTPHNIITQLIPRRKFYDELIISNFLSKKLSTLGHSQGAVYAYMYGDEGFETIVYNPAPYNNNVPSNTWVIKRNGDVASVRQHHGFTDQHVITLDKIENTGYADSSTENIKIQHGIESLKSNPYIYGNPLLYNDDNIANSEPVINRYKEDYPYEDVKLETVNRVAVYDGMPFTFNERYLDSYNRSNSITSPLEDDEYNDNAKEIKLHQLQYENTIASNNFWNSIPEEEKQSQRDRQTALSRSQTLYNNDIDTYVTPITETARDASIAIRNTGAQVSQSISDTANSVQTSIREGFGHFMKTTGLAGISDGRRN